MVDSEAVTIYGSGSDRTETTERVDAASGQHTVTITSSTDPGHPVTRIYKGDGPEHWCLSILLAKSAAVHIGTVCKGLSHTANSRGSSVRADCYSYNLDHRWRRIDERIWERSSTATPQSSSSPTPDSSQAAVEMAMAGMTPEQRARTQAELASIPSVSQANAAMAPVIEALQAQIRTGNPQEAALARQQLRAIRATLDSGGAAINEARLQQRWTRVADTCPAR
ncbi:MAG: hypothetical protein HY080_07450 [Gammaproteobacteria bacterium]|nr:hypothetical protein [Gammaproteobacteria bacterium]